MSDVATQPSPEDDGADGSTAASRERPASAPRRAAPSSRTSAPHGDVVHTGGVTKPVERRLSPAEAEKVIARALELQQVEGTSSQDGLSLRDIEDVGAQVGVDPALIRRALNEVRLNATADYEPSRTERLFGPRSVAGAAIVPSEATAARRGVNNWMTYDEGMKHTGTRGDVDRWVKDSRLLVEVRRGLQATRGDGVLRDLKAVTIQVEPDETGSIITVGADTSRIRASTIGIIASAVAVGVATGGGAAATLPDTAAIGSDIGQFAAFFGAWSAGGIGTAALVAHTWANRVREAVDQALDGISMSIRHPDIPAPPPTATGWKRTALKWLGGDR